MPGAAEDGCGNAWGIMSRAIASWKTVLISIDAAAATSAFPLVNPAVVEPLQVFAKRCVGRGRAVRDALRHRGILLELAHRLADDRAHVADGAPLVRAPLGELGQRVRGDRGQLGAGRLDAVHAERLEEQRRLGSEQAEERHFVDAGLLRDAPGGRATEAVCAVETGGGGEDLVAGRCGHVSSGDFGAAGGRGCKYVLALKQAGACT